MMIRARRTEHIMQARIRHIDVVEAGTFDVIPVAHRRVLWIGRRCRIVARVRVVGSLLWSWQLCANRLIFGVEQVAVALRVFDLFPDGGDIGLELLGVVGLASAVLYLCFADLRAPLVFG